MKYCMKCGVQVDDTIQAFCPLCETIILNDEDLQLLTDNRKKERKVSLLKSLKIDHHELLHNKLGFAALMIFLSFTVASFVVLLIDLSINKQLTWSLIPVLSIIVFDSILNLILLSEKKSILTLASLSLLLLIGYFLGLDYLITKGISWSYYVVLSIALLLLGLHIVFRRVFYHPMIKFTLLTLASSLYTVLLFIGPYVKPHQTNFILILNACVFTLGVITYIFVKTYIYNRFLVVGILSFSLSVLVLIIELLLNRFVQGQSPIYFSFYVLIVLIPLAILAFILSRKQAFVDYLKKK